MDGTPGVSGLVTPVQIGLAGWAGPCPHWAPAPVPAMVPSRGESWPGCARARAPAPFRIRVSGGRWGPELGAVPAVDRRRRPARLGSGGVVRPRPPRSVLCFLRPVSGVRRLPETAGSGVQPNINPNTCCCDAPEGGQMTWIHEQGLRTNRSSSSPKTSIVNMDIVSAFVGGVTPCGASWKMGTPVTPQRRTGLTPRAFSCFLILFGTMDLRVSLLRTMKGHV
jgi:hypothetical protein